MKLAGRKHELLTKSCRGIREAMRQHLAILKLCNADQPLSIARQSFAASLSSPAFWSASTASQRRRIFPGRMLSRFQRLGK